MEDGGSWAGTAVQEEAKEARAEQEGVGDWAEEEMEAAERASERGEVSRTPQHLNVHNGIQIMMFILHLKTSKR